ncbi:MAG: hypothetical protein OEW87_10750 [Flavobacteriaceae bacterium]|nr:hypothetical protein [Flavobacteriaceae bacterium]
MVKVEIKNIGRTILQNPHLKMPWSNTEMLTLKPGQSAIYEVDENYILAPFERIDMRNIIAPPTNDGNPAEKFITEIECVCHRRKASEWNDPMKDIPDFLKTTFVNYCACSWGVFGGTKRQFTIPPFGIPVVIKLSPLNENWIKFETVEINYRQEMNQYTGEWSPRVPIAKGRKLKSPKDLKAIEDLKVELIKKYNLKPSDIDDISGIVTIPNELPV